MIKTTAFSSQTDGSGTFTVATWNICSGWDGGLESDLWEMGTMGVDIAFFTDTNFMRRIYTRSSSEYLVRATKDQHSSWGS